MLKVLIVDFDAKRSNPLKQSLIDNGFEVIAHVQSSINLDKQCSELKPDVVIVDIDSPCRDTLENICLLSAHDARPIVMFSHDGDKEKIKAATRAGVSAYVVGTIASERLTPLINAAIARFEEFHNLRSELTLANTKLEDRKVIERAKGILIKQRNLDEDQAYAMLREMAMKRNMKVADLAKQLVAAASMLIV